MARYCRRRRGLGRGWPGLLPELSAAATALFRREILGPLYRRAGWSLQRVLTDGGSAFNATFADTCRRLGLQHRRTLPRHAWTNGCVERRQGMIRDEH